MRQRAVRIGVGLKIDDKTLADPLMGKQRQAGLNLVGDRRMVRRFDGMKNDEITKKREK